MPCANAPNAPWVEVWLSPQTIVVPGSVKPLLGADDVDDALTLVEFVEIRNAECARVFSQRGDLLGAFPDRGSAWNGRWSARCDRRRRASSAARGLCGQSSVDPRRPAATSPRAPDAGRYTEDTCRRRPCAPDDRSRSCRREWSLSHCDGPNCCRQCLFGLPRVRGLFTRLTRKRKVSCPYKMLDKVTQCPNARRLRPISPSSPAVGAIAFYTAAFDAQQKALMLRSTACGSCIANSRSMGERSFCRTLP